MSSPLDKMKQAYQEAKKQQPEGTTLQDVVVNINSGEFEFIWNSTKKD